MMFTRDNILKELRNNVIDVTFDKVNGERRVLRCTLRQDMLPPNYIVEADHDFHAKNENHIAAWDVMNKGWRSFRIDSVVWVEDVNSNY